MIVILPLCFFLAVLGVPSIGKHVHLCGKNNHNGSTGVVQPHDGKLPAGHNCNWHIYPESYNIPEVFLIVEEFQLDKDDNFTVRNHDNMVLLFGPFNGTLDTFTILTGFLYLDIPLNVMPSPPKDRSFRLHFTTNDCFYLIEQDSGSMTSPLYHDVSIRKNATCTWVFKKFKQVMSPRTVIFKSFHLIKSTLTVKGSKAQDGVYTGTKLPPNVTAFGETQFILNLNTAVPGETFSFQYGHNGLEITSSDELVDNDGQLKKSTPISLSSGHPCGHVVLQDPTGWFAPKNFTMQAGHSCKWIIGPVSRPSGVYVVIQNYKVIDDDEFLLQQPSETRTYFGPYCGNKAPLSFFIDDSEVAVILRTSGTDLLRKRHFKAFYSTSGCDFSITNDFGIMHSPVYKTDDKKETSCSWSFVLSDIESVVFISFEEYNIKSSNLLVFDSLNQDQVYRGSDGPFDILMKSNGNLTLEIDRTVENELLSFSYYTVNHECSDYIKIMKEESTTLSFPQSGLNEKTFVSCQWIIEGNKNGALAVYFEDISLHDAKDLLVIKEGRTRKAATLVEATEDNQEDIEGSCMVASSNFIWVSFTTRSAFKGSHFKISVNVSQEINHLHEGQDFTIVPPESGVDVIFYLEVGNEEQVLLNMVPGQELPSSGRILVYDGFNVNTVLSKIQKDKVFYPIVSTGSKMMLVAKDFTKGNSVKLRFDGIKKGCHQVTLNHHGIYQLSGYCNSTCSWVILPKSDDSQEMLSLRMASVALRPGDVIEVRQLDDALSLIEMITSSKFNKPNIYLPASYGAYVKIIRMPCLSTDTVSTAFFASIETIKGCSMNIDMRSSQKVSLTSPNYPDVYPFNSNCFWNVSTKANNLYVSFKSFQLADGHCMKIHEMEEKSGHVIDTVTYEDSVIPDDKMFRNIIAFQLVASPCRASNQTTPTSGNGFIIDVYAIDCGGTVGKEMQGKFSTPGYPKPVKGNVLCIWNVEVPFHNKDDGSVNVIFFSIKWSSPSTDNETGLTIYDGPSLSSEVLINKTTTKGLMSRKNIVIFKYEHNDTSDHPGLEVDFESRTGSMLCDNGIYMHQDWICNGMDECGDYSDEKNCEGHSLPPPPVPPLPPNINVTHSGVPHKVFWSVVPISFLLGIVLTIGTAYVMKKLRQRREREYDTLPILS